MKIKKFLPIVIIVVAIAILIPVYFVVTSDDAAQDEDFSDKRGTHGETLNSQGRPFIIEPIDEDDIACVKVTNSAGGYEFFRGEDGQMYLRGAEQHLYNTQLQKQLYTNVATYILAIEKLESHDELVSYGLTPETASATVEITDTDGNFYKLYFGDKLATGGSYYALLDGRDAVYVVDTMLESVLFCTPQDFIYPLMVPSIDQTDYTSISSFSLKKNGEQFVDIVKMSAEEEAQSVIYGQYKMTYPTEYTPSSDNMTTILQSFITFAADRVLDFGITEEKLAYYGFKTGMKYEISYTYNGVEYVLYFSGKTGNNTYYVYSPLFDLIGEINADNVAFLEWDLIKFVDRNIFMINIDNIAAIDLTYQGGTASFVLTGEGDTLAVACNGATVDTTNFRYFYKSLLSVCIDGYESLPENSSPYITLTVTTRNAQVLQFDFYEVGSLKAFFTLNGNGEFYVRRDYLRTVLSNLSKLQNGETIE